MALARLFRSRRMRLTGKPKAKYIMQLVYAGVFLVCSVLPAFIGYVKGPGLMMRFTGNVSEIATDYIGDVRQAVGILFWGILGAIVMRFLFIFLLGAVIHKFSWVLAVFGVILIYSGIKMFRDKGDKRIDTANHPVVKLASRFLPVSRHTHGHDFFVKNDGRVYMTPLFLVLLVIEFSDVIFAVDSIPAVFSVTTDTYIVYFSNIFAIMGLRSLFFLLSNVTDMFWLLKYGLGVLLCFIGVKMIGHEFFGWEIGTMVSLAVILGILVASIGFSLLFPKKKQVEPAA
jgi:tellurite resistance protein TerC